MFMIMNTIPSETTTRPTIDSTERHSRAARRIRRAATILVAVLVAIIDWVVCSRLIGLQLMVDQGTGPILVSPIQIVAAPIVSGLTGWGLLAILERISPQRGARSWMIIAIVIAVLSCWSPLTMALSVSTAIALASMHLLVGATLIIGMMISGSRRR